MFTQPFIQAQIKENIKAPRHWPLCGEIHRWPVNSPHKWPVTRKMFPFDDVIMETICWGLVISPTVMHAETNIIDSQDTQSLTTPLARSPGLSEMTIGQPYLWAEVARQTCGLKIRATNIFLCQAVGHYTPMRSWFWEVICKVTIMFNHILLSGSQFGEQFLSTKPFRSTSQEISK